MTASPITRATGSQSGVRKTRRPLGCTLGAATTTGLASEVVWGPTDALCSRLLESCGVVAVLVGRRAIWVSLQVRPCYVGLAPRSTGDETRVGWEAVSQAAMRTPIRIHPIINSVVS